MYHKYLQLKANDFGNFRGVIFKCTLPIDVQRFLQFDRRS